MTVTELAIEYNLTITRRDGLWVARTKDGVTVATGDTLSVLAYRLRVLFG